MSFTNHKNIRLARTCVNLGLALTESVEKLADSVDDFTSGLDNKGKDWKDK